MKYQFDKNAYKVYRWWHPAYLFWIINPGSVINELLLGQRIPKLSLLNKTSGNQNLKVATFHVLIVKVYTKVKNGHLKIILLLETGLVYTAIVAEKQFLVCGVFGRGLF